jgi:hypothetical protein
MGQTVRQEPLTCPTTLLADTDILPAKLLGERERTGPLGRLLAARRN